MSEASERSYAAGLKLLARRELSEAQLRARLSRTFTDEEIDAAVGRLRHEHALDDRRTALACARTEAHRKHHGRLRALRQLEAIGIPRTVARATVAEVFADIDEGALIAQVLDRRLRRRGAGNEAAAVRRVHRYLLSQGFDASQVIAVIRERTSAAEDW